MKPRIREHLRNAQTLSLTRDARRQRLLIRFGSCDGKGNSHAGILGLVRDFGDNAGEIVKATRHILKRVCTSWGAPPRWYHGPPAYFNEELFNYVRYLAANYFAVIMFEMNEQFHLC